MFRLSLDGGMTCPNRDGTVGIGGCVFCSEQGSGDFAQKRVTSISNQIEAAKAQVSKKLPKNGMLYGYIAYFQSFTNTYAPIDYLRFLFTETLKHTDIEALFIGTRPDCLPESVLSLLSELSKIKPIYVELGLQTEGGTYKIPYGRGGFPAYHCSAGTVWEYSFPHNGNTKFRMQVFKRAGSAEAWAKWQKEKK